MIVYRDVVVNGKTTQTKIFDIAECTYTGKDMGERSIVANIKWPSPIDFEIGDYVMLPMQSLVRSANGVDGSVLSGMDMERFYIYSMPTIKKNARPLSSGQAFEHTVTFYPAQYELGLIQMRDCGQEQANADTIIYTGFDSLSFVGGAYELIRRIMAVLKEAYHDADGNPLWSYQIADAANENKNTALERVSFSFSGNSVMDALLKLNDKEGLNTSFFINGRTIYVGYKRPYFCRVTDGGSIDTNPDTQMFQFEYGKTSHQSIAINHGGLYQIIKTLGKETPITKLFAYGAARNLNRYYCSDRIKSGRYVNRVMLPSFDADGKTDYIMSEEGVKKYGIRESSKQFEEVYPSLRYMTYGDLRQIKYCIKVRYSGITNDKLEQGGSAYPVARVQCYKVVPSGKTTGINKLVEAAPPEDLCVIVHAMGKTVKVVLYGGNTDDEAIQKQRQHDSKVPTRTANGTDYIPGSCFLVHDRGFDTNKAYQNANRSAWFTNPNSFPTSLTDAQKTEINMNQIQYEDTFWLSDLYVFEGYGQIHFSRDGYSAWSWPRTNIDYMGGSADSTAVNEVVAAEPIVIEDTSSNVDDLTTQQKTFDLYLKDVGFQIDEQNDFGDMVFVVGSTLKISMLDGLMAGREFEAAGKVTDSQYTCICAYKDDGSLNDDFFMDSDYNKGRTIPEAALNAGAIWRVCCSRINLDEADYSNLNLILPTKDLCVKKGDHLVFLDIFMPDIYIHAAENRLLREARKYLEANDSGNVTYSAQFDKVRLQQIPNYALQMREGLNIRMVDDDLDISTDNDGRYLSNYGDKPLYSSTDVPYTRSAWEYVTDYRAASVHNGITQEFMDKFGHNVPENGDEMTVRIVLRNDETWIDRAPVQIIQSGTTYSLGAPQRVLSYGWSEADGGYLYMLIFATPIGLNLSNSVVIKRHQIKADSALKKSVWLSSNDAIDFKRGRFYTFKCSVKDTGYLAAANALALLSAKNDGIDNAKFLPTYTLTTEHKEKSGLLYLTFKFELPSNFNDDVVYYPSVLFNTDSRESSVGMWVESMYEKDFADGTAKLNYADFTVDSLTIKITDNSYDTPIREISATFAENPAANTWATLMSKIDDTKIESDQNVKAIETLVNTARKNYQTLLNLRNSIFDPDGTCDQTFLQVMMLQVGADSMNYQLDKTRTGLSSGGQQVFHNCSLTKSGSVWTFKVLASDTLRHFVYTQGSQSGTWLINNGITQVLDGKSNYFICAKCEREGSTGEWICSTKQYAVNDKEDTTAWFFNWGILTVDGGGNYTLVETRGNAYMYGDNLVCGKISTLAGNSYFDLTHGNFVLSDGTSKALSYENGILTIGGVNDTDADSILTRLGITEATANSAQSTANAAQTAANQANAEAEKVRAEYQAAITAEEQARNTAITNVQNSIGSLQNQIDGEVTAWFLKGVPTLDNQPAADWKILNDNGTINTTATELEYKRHEGDTYTNMSSYEEDSENAGKSWRFCKGVENTPKSSWHWHLIADSDAVKALVEAGKAQSTADGKSTTFVKKPTSYQVGDLWILQTDTDHTEGKKGDILTANVSSETYNANHWSKDVKYTDDTVANQAVSDAANAKSAADNARSVADAATTRLNNWAEDGVISPAEKQGIKDEIARIDADKSHITSEYAKYGLGTPTAFNTAHTNYRAILVTLSSTATEIITIPSDFSTKQTAYYNARTAALTAISTKADEVAKAYADTVSASAAQAALDNLEIGGRNLAIFKTAATVSMKKGANYDFQQTDIDTKTALFLNCDDFNGSNGSSYEPYLHNEIITETGTYSYTFTLIADTSLLRIKHNGREKDAISIFYFTEPLKVGTKLVLSITFTNVTQGTFAWKNVKIEKGNKATDWTPAPEDVEASIAENKEYAEGLVTALGDNLQNQIDGVVDSYFMEGVPTTSNAPANEWTTDELKKRHEGDTYTNIQQYTKLEKDVWEQGSFAESQVGKEWVVGQAKYNGNMKPIRLAELMENKKGNVIHLSDYGTYKFVVLYFDANKKLVVANFWKTADFVTEDYPYIAISVNRIDGTQTSIADVVASGVVINPDAGKSWRWCKGSSDNPATTWHWHEIADSDAVRALQNAAKAQDTADGKRRVFVVQPTPPYEIGDLWAQGDGDGKDILKCKTARAAGQTFAQADWEAASSALRTAGSAQEAAEEAKKTLANIASDSVFTKQEKCSVRTEWASIQAEFTKNTNNAKVCWGESGYGNNAEYKAYQTAYTALNNYLTNTAKLSVNEDTEIKPDEFNKAFSDYYGANVTLLNAIAKRVSELEAQAAIDNLEVGGENLYIGDNPRTIAAQTSNYNYVKILTGLQNGSKYVFSCGKAVAKAGSTTQYAVLLYDFTNITSQQKRLLPVGSTRVEQAFTIPSTGTWDMLIYSGVNGSTAGISMEYTDIMVQKGNKATDYQKPTRKWYYSGNISISYAKYASTSSKLLCSNLSVGDYICEMSHETEGISDSIQSGAFSNSCLVWFSVRTKEHIKITNWGEKVHLEQAADLYVYIGQKSYIEYVLDDNNDIQFVESGTWIIYNANISTYRTDFLSSAAYEAKVKIEALDYLKAAIANGSTEVAGGLLMTNVLMLRDLANTVTAGLSGLTKYKPSGSSTTLEDLVLLWGGATYDEAFYAARNAGYLKKAGGDPITTLLKKDGTGKIGIFKISEDSVVVETNNGRVVIDAENGISVHDSDGNERAVLTDKALDLSALKVNTKVTLPTTLNLTKETQIIDPNGSVNFYGTIATVPAETNCALRINNLLVQTVKMPENYVTGSACACTITLSVGSQKVSSYYDYYAEQGASGDNYVRFSNGKFTDIPLTSNVQIRVNVNLNGNSGWTAQNTPVSVRISCDVCYVMSTESKTVIGSNGFYSMFDGNNMFAVINNKSGQSVFAKGLPTTTSGLSAGQIYKDSSGILRIWGG